MRRKLLNAIGRLMPPWDCKSTTLFHPTMPSQSMGEWRTYLEFVETYFRNRGIKKPMVVEIGIGFGKQKRFYEEVLGYTHIGVDYRKARSASEVGAEGVSLSIPDIVGDSHAPKTKAALVAMLKGREVNIVYLDALHNYEALKMDYAIYSPLAKDMIVIHDITFVSGVKRFWEELIAEAVESQAQDKTFITLTGYYIHRRGKKFIFGQGTGIILLEDGNG